MSEYLESKDIEQLMAEADELVKRIDADAITNMEEEHRLQVEIQASPRAGWSSSILKSFIPSIWSGH